MALREQLVDLLRNGNIDLPSDLGDDTPLISDGLLDSLGLFNLALWIETQTGAPIDLTSIDPSGEWNTIEDILTFIGRHGEGAPREIP
jgi:acyl carrier protein